MFQVSRNEQFLNVIAETSYFGLSGYYWTTCTRINEKMVKVESDITDQVILVVQILCTLMFQFILSDTDFVYRLMLQFILKIPGLLCTERYSGEGKKNPNSFVADEDIEQLEKIC